MEIQKFIFLVFSILLIFDRYLTLNIFKNCSFFRVLFLLFFFSVIRCARGREIKQICSKFKYLSLVIFIFVKVLHLELIFIHPNLITLFCILVQHYLFLQHFQFITTSYPMYLLNIFNQ